MLVRGLDAWQVAERGRFMPWLAVFMGTGVLGYFALRVEPPLWLGASVVVPLVCASLRANSPPFGLRCRRFCRPTRPLSPAPSARSRHCPSGGA
jgi:hypothetical protein